MLVDIVFKSLIYNWLEEDLLSKSLQKYFLLFNPQAQVIASIVQNWLLLDHEEGARGPDSINLALNGVVACG